MIHGKEISKFYKYSYKKQMNFNVHSKTSLVQSCLEFIQEKNTSKDLPSNIKVCIVCILAGGSGDAMLAIKFRNQLESWFPHKLDITIATNGIVQMKNLGEALSKKIFLQPLDHGELQHRPFDKYAPYQVDQAMKLIQKGKKPEEINLKGYEASLNGFDCYFVVPLSADLSPTSVSRGLRQRQITKLIPTANMTNTFFASEYNIPLSKEIHIPLGVGEDRLGILVNSTSVKLSKPKLLSHPYTVMYLADNDNHLTHCIKTFIHMLVKEYSNLSRLDIVLPKNVADEIKLKDLKTISATIKLQTKEGQKVLKEDPSFKQEIVLRADIFPLPWDEMRGLLKYSLPTLLLTGDQSFSDALSVIKKDKFTIWYQPLEWKVNFKSALARELPMPAFKSWKTSCGKLHGMQFFPQYKDFLQHWSFSREGKQTVLACLILASSKEPWFITFRSLFTQKLSIRSMKQALKNI